MFEKVSMLHQKHQNMRIISKCIIEENLKLSNPIADNIFVRCLINYLLSTFEVMIRKVLCWQILNQWVSSF